MKVAVKPVKASPPKRNTNRRTRVQVNGSLLLPADNNAAGNFGRTTLVHLGRRTATTEVKHTGIADGLLDD